MGTLYRQVIGVKIHLLSERACLSEDFDLGGSTENMGVSTVASATMEALEKPLKRFCVDRDEQRWAEKQEIVQKQEFSEFIRVGTGL